jgi:hypothetical protein
MTDDVWLSTAADVDPIDLAILTERILLVGRDLETRVGPHYREYLEQAATAIAMHIQAHDDASPVSAAVDLASRGELIRYVGNERDAFELLIQAAIHMHCRSHIRGNVQ